MPVLDEGPGGTLRCAYNGRVYLSEISESLYSLDAFRSHVASICRLDNSEHFTLKWLDDESDPCVVSSQLELDEAFRISKNGSGELFVYVFCGPLPEPGESCADENREMYRRGARRWTRLYTINGHSFQAKRFGKRAHCIICRDVIWGLGRQGYRCIRCKLHVHKKCARHVAVVCGEEVNYYQNSGSLPINSGRTVEPPKSHSLPHNELSNGKLDTMVHPENETTPANSSSVGLRDFEFIRVIGRGSYAKVLMVEYKRTGRIYAMKIIKKALVVEDEDIDWVQTEKHVFEIASNHPFLVGLHSCFQTTSRLFFVIEFVSGGDLMYHMQRQRKLPEEHGRFYAAEISSALHFLHSRGIIYRDLKLDNVLLDKDGHLKLTDYGMCKEGMDPYSVTGTFCGTPNYIAPEILTGDSYGFSVDWWALGVLTYEMLAGRSPFDVVRADASETNTEEYLFQIILEKPIRMPRSLSVRATSLLKGFLNKTPADRLGCDPKSGFTDIKNHPFFRAIDWNLLEHRQIPPPYIPTVEFERDLTNFDPQFTDEPVTLTPDNRQVLDNIDQSEFEGFEYVNPLLMSSDDPV